MPDITMCLNHSCPMRFTCYRFTAVPGEWQSYSCFKPVNGECNAFMEGE